MTKLKLRELLVKGKRVLVRVDFNVPIDRNGCISDDTRIKSSIPTINYILTHGGSVILMSHLGRPKGVDPSLSLSHCAKRLSDLLNKPVQFAADSVGPEVEKMAEALQPGEILLLENLRFHPGEESPDLEPDFVGKLAKLGDLYVNDAFGTAHRAHSSTALIARFFPNDSAEGLLMEKEVSALGCLVQNPEHPFYAIIGGSKISSKIGLIEKLLDTVDALFIGGAMAFTFFKAQGIDVGSSLVEDDQVQVALAVLKKAKRNQLVFPVDLVIANQISESAISKIVSVKDGIEGGMRGLDIGPETVKEWGKRLIDGSTIFWNGPVGVFEIPKFACGTKDLAVILSASKGKVIVGGGDSIAAIEQTGLSNLFYHLSTGGGASLEFLENARLPGIDALTDA
jgi:3-phosphoglycerate kinase